MAGAMHESSDMNSRNSTRPEYASVCRVHTVWVVSMHPVARLVQGVHSVAMAADDCLLGARPSEGAVLRLHKAHSQPLRCVGDEAPQVG